MEKSQYGTLVLPPVLKTELLRDIQKEIRPGLTIANFKQPKIAFNLSRFTIDPAFLETRVAQTTALSPPSG